MKELPYPWLDGAWERLQSMRDRLPHALLIYGNEGIGKRAFGLHFAQSLLCERQSATGHPCGHCGACRWFSDGNHPDFREVIPEVLQVDPEMQEGEVADDEGGAKGRKVRSREIKIEQIRRLDSFFNVGTHRGGRRVVSIYPADVLNVASGNALLKTLEEPPPATVFLLVSSHADQVSPTVRSRCTNLLVPRPAARTASEWLAAKGVADADALLAEAGGAPLVALGAADDPTFAFRAILIEALAGPGAIDPVSLAEKCEKGGAPGITAWLSRWVADVLLCKISGEVRYHPRQKIAIARLASISDQARFLAFFRHLARMRRVAEHPLNPRLFAEDLLIEYARLTAHR